MGKRANPEPPPGGRLQKVLAQAGFGSRRACEELIASGRVRVNGERAPLGRRVDPGTDVVEVDGVRVSLETDLVYLALNKPAGVVTTARDPKARQTVLDLVPNQPRVFPVGRLDRDTAGLLLLTNDGDLALRVTHPRYGIPKVYVAEIAGRVGGRVLARLRRGIDLEDGPARAEEARVIGAGREATLIEVTVRQGRKRMVRRLIAAADLDLRSLTRVAIGPLRLGHLKPGRYRTLGRREILELLQAARASDDANRPKAERPVD